MITLDCQRFTYDDGAGLTDVQLHLERGSLVTVVGASAAGKSTLARLLAGQVDPLAGQLFHGSISLSGEQLIFAGRADDPRIDPGAWSARVGYVGQNAWSQLSLVCATVGEEIGFGPANRGMPAVQLRALVRRTAEHLGLLHLLERDPRRLSGGELQRVCIAATVVQGPELLVLDEPFQGLDDRGRREVEELLSVLRAAGTAVLVCEPMLPAAWGSEHRIVALAGGRIVFEGTLTEARTAALETYGIGFLGDIAPQDVMALPACRGPAIELAAVEFTYPSGDGPRTTGEVRTSLTVERLDVRRGEALALLGPNGSGKSTVLQQVNGLLRPSSGTVRVLGDDIAHQTTGRIAARVGYLFQNTDQQLFERTVRREVAYGPRSMGAGRVEAHRRALASLESVGLSAQAEDHPHELGFAQRRLVALACLLATGAEIWVLDEPTAGLDVCGRDMMAKLIRGHVQDGGAVVMASHDLSFTRSVCTRAVTLDNGRISGGWSSE